MMEIPFEARCPTCGSTDTVHGDCLVCNSPLAARSAETSAPPGVLSAERTVASVVDALVPRFPASTVASHLSELPPSYLMRTPAAVIGDHIALIGRAGGGTAVEHSNRGGVDCLTVATSDRPGILAVLAGVLAAHGVNITGATADTKSGGTAIDVLFVEFAGAAKSEGSWSQLCANVAKALSGEFDVDAAVMAARAKFDHSAGVHMPTTVYVDNETSSRFTRVEVNAADRVGLLYAISRAMAGVGLDIHLAQVETVGTAAVDTFYVRHEDASRIESPTEIERLKGAVISAVDALTWGLQPSSAGA